MEKALQLIKNSPYIISQDSWHYVEKQIHKILSYKRIEKIILLPKNIQFIDTACSTTTIAVGIVGWTVWTMMDDIRDEKINDTQILYVYSVLRPIMDEFIHSLKMPDQHLDCIRKIIGTMEYANSDMCTFSVSEKDIFKSIGATVPMIMLLVNIGANQKNIDLCYAYFYHFIGARQLSDDALDWPEDMKKGHRTLVTEWFKEAAGNGKSIKEYRKFSNDIVAPKVDNKILWHARKSIGYARQITCFKSTEPLEELPKFYEDMATELIAKRKDRKLKKIPK